LIPVLIFAALGALLLATRRWDARAWWGLGGVSLLVPLGIWQAYAGAVTYTHANGVPSLRKVIVLVAALYVVAAGFATVLRGVSRWVVDRAGRPPAQQVAGLLVCAAALGLLVVGYLRSRLFGASYGKGSLGISGIRTYDEANLHRLTWFLSYPGVALAGLGVAVVALRRWSTTAWVFVAPSLVLTVVYLYHSHNSPQLMFWGRRYVPSVVPFFCAAAGLALAAVWRSRTMAMRAAALAATGGLVGFFLSQSLPVRGHEEWTGSFALSRRVAALSGGHGRTGGLFLVGRFGGSEGADKVLGAALWLERDQLAALLPATYTAADLRAYVRAFPGRPVFVVTQGDTPPPGAASVAYRVDVTTRLWQERVEPRPDHAVTVPEHATIWRVDTS
jgi:hypothetical protein